MSSNLTPGTALNRATFVDGGLEHALAEMWPAWADTRQQLVDAGAGFSGKDQATYEEATISAPGEVPELLQLVVNGARTLLNAA